jgi:hypothetical protein
VVKRLYSTFKALVNILIDNANTCLETHIVNTALSVAYMERACCSDNARSPDAVRALRMGLVVRVPGYRFGGPGSIPGATRFSEK